MFLYSNEIVFRGHPDKEFDLRNFDYIKTAQFGHFGFDFPWEKI